MNPRALLLLSAGLFQKKGGGICTVLRQISLTPRSYPALKRVFDGLMPPIISSFQPKAKSLRQRSHFESFLLYHR